jgi:hypothetical protein
VLAEGEKAVGSPVVLSEREGLRDPSHDGCAIGDGRAQATRSRAKVGRHSRGRETRRRGPATSHLPVDLLEAVFGARRDPKTSYEAYLRYRDRGCRARDLDLAFACALPVIREVCSSRDRSHIGAAAWALWRALRERRFAAGGRPAYWAYLRLTARGAMAHQRAADHRFTLIDRVAPEVCVDGMGLSGRLPGIRDVERKMVVEKIPFVIIDEVVGRLPYEGEELAACLFFLEALLDGRDVAATGLSDLFDVPRTRLRPLLDHVAVMARMAMWRLRVELRAAAGNDLGWQGALSMRAWLYGEPEDDARGE